MRIDLSDDGDVRADAADAPRARGVDAAHGAAPDRGTAPESDGVPGRDLAGKNADHGAEAGSAERVARNLEYRATVDAADRAYAIDQGCARVQEIEGKIVTPAMRRVEAEDPDRALVGLENRLKGQERLAEKISKAMSERSRTAAQAFAETKDAIRYTLQYPDEKYVTGIEVISPKVDRTSGL